MTPEKDHRSTEPKTPCRETGIFSNLSELARSPIALVLWAALTGVAVVAQPFNSYGHMPVAARFVYWSVIVGVSIPVVVVSDRIARRVTPSGNRIGIVSKAIVVAVMFCAPAVVLWNEVFVSWYPGMDDSPFRIAFNVGATAVAVFVLIETFRPRLAAPVPYADAARAQEPDRKEPDRKEPDREEPRPRLSQRLDNPAVTIMRLSANDHLIDVVSEQGVEQIRMRFADAVNEMEPMPGCCVHRSHWVALHAIKGLVRRKDKLFVVLTNGEDIPVSRTYRPELEAARPDLF